MARLNMGVCRCTVSHHANIPNNAPVIPYQKKDYPCDPPWHSTTTDVKYGLRQADFAPQTHVFLDLFCKAQIRKVAI